MIGALLDRHPKVANWIYGFTPPERGLVVLVHRRVYIVPTQLGYLFGMTLLILLVGSINYAASLPVDEFVSRITAKVLRRFLS